MPYKDKDKQREYQRLWIKRRREEYLSDKSCVECGSKDALEVHHTDPTLKVDHKVWSWAQIRRDEELSKCEVLCKACHLKSHGYVLGGAHGKASTYKINKCRCDLCKAANTASHREYRKRRAEREKK